MKTIKLFLAITTLSIASSLTAQVNGIIKGNILDEKGKPMLFVPIALFQDSTIITSATTDENGEFTMKEITPGKYNLKASYLGYKTLLLKDVVTHPNKTAYVDMKMSLSENTLKTTVVTAHFHETIIDKDFSTLTPISIEQIENSALGKTDIVALITSLTPGIVATADGRDIHIRGSRVGTTGYIVDGMRTMGVPEIPGLGIAGMEVLTGGVPAEYGDCTGGIVIISTKEYKWEASRKKIAQDAKREAEEEGNE